MHAQEGMHQMLHCYILCPLAHIQVILIGASIGNMAEAIAGVSANAGKCITVEGITSVE